MMLYITTLGDTVLAARLTEKDALQVIHDTLTYPEFEEDQLVEGLTPSELVHRYLNPTSGKWVDSGYKITQVINPMTQHHALQELLSALESASDNGDSHRVAGYEYGVKIQEASGIERILDPESLELTARNRLEQYRKTWPTAKLVRRPVFDEPWEVADES
jgi:hypothetical protein